MKSNFEAFHLFHKAFSDSLHGLLHFWTPKALLLIWCLLPYILRDFFRFYLHILGNILPELTDSKPNTIHLYAWYSQSKDVGININSLSSPKSTGNVLAGQCGVIFTHTRFKEPHLQTLQTDSSSQVGEPLHHACTTNDSLRNCKRKGNLK